MAASVFERNNVQITGSGDATVVFAHGFGCDQHMWRFITPDLAPNYRCLLFDYVGFGESDVDAYDSARYNSLDGYAQDVIDVITAADADAVTFVGHSVSGIIGILAAIERPDLFDRLVLICPSPRYLNDPPDYHGGFERDEIEGLLEMMDKNYIGWAHSFAPKVVQDPTATEVVAELDETFCSTDPTIARQFAEVTFLGDNRDDVARTPVPTLSIHCSDDSLAPPSVTSFMDEALPEHSRVRVLDATGHCPHMTCPDATVAALRPFLSQPA